MFSIDYKKAIKETLNYLLRILIFLLLNRAYIIEPLTALMAIIIPNDLEAEDEILVVVILFIIYFYLTIKISGIFKKLDNLNFFLAFFIIFIINTIFNGMINATIQLNPPKIIGFEFTQELQAVTIFFILYRITHFLGKKFPNSIGRIGCYCSIEFYKDTFEKLKKRP